MSGSGQEAFFDVREWLGGHPGSPGDPTEYPGVVGRLSWVSRSCREALPDVWEWSGGPPECAGVVGRPSRMSGSGREILTNIRK